MTNDTAGRLDFLISRFGVAATPTQSVVALAGNPNVGKSTIFNALTGLHQHTGNWPGKTVDHAQGEFTHRDRAFLLVDLPGTYSILAHSAEEEVARDFLCFARPDAALVVLDASCMERNLNLALQVMEITPKTIVCVNLLDEAEKKGIWVDLEALRRELGVPVVGTAARTGRGLEELKEALFTVASGKAVLQPRKVDYSPIVEHAVAELLPVLETADLPTIDRRWLAMRLLEGEPSLFDSILKEAHPCLRN